MHRRILATTVLVALMSAGAAQAADLSQKVVTKAPVAAPFTWSGFYIGAQAGYGWGQNDFSNSYDPLFPSTLSARDAQYSIDGGMLGGQIGFNWQISQYVIGVEADAAWANIEGDGSYFNGIAPSCIQSNDPCTSKIDALGTITARLGVAFDHVLLYAKGGAAWARSTHTAGYTDPNFPLDNYHASVDETRWGWTIGAGIEYAFTNNWSAKVEYNYMDLGSGDVTFGFTPNIVINPYVASLDQTLSVVKAGVNYRF